MSTTTVATRAARGTAIRLGLIVVVALGLVALSPGTACACTCVPRQAAAVVKDASAVVLGTPVSRDEDGSVVRYRVEVTESYKQRVPQTITVITSSSSASCGVALEVGTQRLLVLGGAAEGVAAAEGEWGASLCDNSTNLSEDDIVRYAGSSIEPYTGADEREPQPVVIGAFVAIAALIAIPGGIMWWRVRQRRARPSFDD